MEQKTVPRMTGHTNCRRDHRTTPCTCGFEKQSKRKWFFLSTQLSPVEKFLKSLGGNGNDFGIQLLPDLAFLRQLSIQGRLRYNQGIGTTLISIIPTEGTTQFFYSMILGSSAIGNNTFTVSNDGMTRIINIIDTTTTQFTLFDSLVGNGSKAFTITASQASADASVFSWTENTSRIRDVTTWDANIVKSTRHIIVKLLFVGVNYKFVVGVFT